MTVIPTTGAIVYPLLPIIQRVFPNVQSYNVDENIVQANAEGFCVQLNTNDNNDDDDAIQTTTNTRNESNIDIFVKCVEASKYSHKPWGDLRRTLLYARTEARFYSNILPLLKEQSCLDDGDDCWKIAPTCYLAESYLDGLIGEDESAAAKALGEDDPKYDTDDYSILEGKGGNLILSSMKGGYYQTSPLNMSQASQCLSAIAKFHASAFGNKELLKKVSQELCEYGGSYHLRNRNQKEIANIRTTWADFMANIRDGAPNNGEFFDRENIRNIGQRIYDVAEYVAEELSPSYDDEFATIVHGDYKAMNVFLPLDENRNKEPLLIDFASCGVGMGVSDVAMHITHAILPKDLSNGGEEKLVEGYLKEFQNALPPSKQGLYTKDISMRHYRFATVDYFRFVLGRLWRGATLESFEKKKNSKNAVLVSRNVEAALAFIERTDRYLEEIENEIKDKEATTCINK